MTIPVRAPVDILIIPVVRALLAFPEVATLYSCQGTSALSDVKDWAWPKDGAYIVFLVGGGSAIELSIFLDFLAERVGAFDAHIQLEITVPGGAPQIEMRTQQEHLDKLAQWLVNIRKDWRGLRAELAARVAKFQ
jgi:hypothetical protein